MEDLMHNQTIRISGDHEGVYRVVLFDLARNVSVLVCLQGAHHSNSESEHDTDDDVSCKSNRTLCGTLLWFEAEKLKCLGANGKLAVVNIQRENFNDSSADTARFVHRLKVMSKFLDLDILMDSILTHGSLGPLVKQAVIEHNVTRSFVYVCWSLMCRYGFAEDSLRSRYDRCGAPGVVRDCSLDGRRKAGRKTNRERLQQKNGEVVTTSQPGMNAKWRHLILAADKKIPTPKPTMAKRYTDILERAFVRDYRQEDGKLVAQKLKKGEYPNKPQVKRVLEIELPRLQRLLDSTTSGHYARSKRGMTGKNWEGVGGPGHTWAIDSTLGDIYLRSSINRAWVIGRPIVYVIVDVWSTAVVGLHVCMRGPSWDTAKVALFNSVADPLWMSQFQEYETSSALHPLPTLPHVLLCDRGEYLSKAASVTAFKLLPCLSYTPPYRPDLKGLVEVLHRIGKDHQQWVPGAIDARREEFELRKFDPNTGVFTVPEYTQYLRNIFMEYNLTANRASRLDAHMIADGVFPSPAGLWHWGHTMGIGVRRSIDQPTLIKSLLHSAEATVRKSGVSFNNLNYRSDETVAAAWTAEARNFGSWSIPVHYYPGTVSRIWTPNMAGAGMLELQLTDQANASAELTFEEVDDAVAFGKLSSDDHEHDRTAIKVDSHGKNKELVNAAKARTAEALEKDEGEKRTLRESRKEEQAKEQLPSGAEPSAPDEPETPRTCADGEDAYLEMMKEILADTNGGGV